MRNGVGLTIALAAAVSASACATEPRSIPERMPPPPPQLLPEPPPPPPPGYRSYAPSHIANPNWVARPSGSDVARAYPPAARAAGVHGRATLGCEVTPSGMLANCVVIAEAPQGYGFGAAALSLVPYFRMSPQTAEGRPAGGAKVRIPVTFRPG
ncbi:MAG TPA: energy transducer TonB [Caulobacteraceae bacterium]|jgi:TonB family protein